MKRTLPITLTLATALLVPALRAEETNKWYFGLTIYGLAPSMDGNVAVKGIPANVDIGFDKIWDNLNFSAMGTVRVGYDRWALSTDVIYMDLEGDQGPATLEVEQLMVQPVLEYQRPPAGHCLCRRGSQPD